MICPKCGFEQEERLDCKRCGIVFAKYYALNPPEDLPQVEGLADPAVTVADAQALSDASELRQSLEELNRRFAELDFERIERTRMRGELRKLDARLDESEKRTAELYSSPPSPTAKEFGELRDEVRAIDLNAIQQKLERLDERTSGLLNSVGQTDPRILEILRKLGERLSELETQAAGEEGDSRGGETPGPDKLERAHKEIEEMRASLQNVTVRYSEIGELKKNHLIILNKMESLQHNLETITREPSNKPENKISQLEKEVSALRAEVRQAINGMEKQDGPAETAPQQWQSFKDELAALARRITEEAERTQAALGELERRLNEETSALSGLPDRLESLATQIRRIDQQYQPLSASVAELIQHTDGTPQKVDALCRDFTLLQEKAGQIQERLQAMEEKFETLSEEAPQQSGNCHASDFIAIRSIMEEIRLFMADLSKKL